jgi:formate hydrogenlyase subunit 3/multisubunit Na+/H+ antiporter MnhD subunit
LTKIRGVLFFVTQTRLKRLFAWRMIHASGIRPAGRRCP